jgi:hypothetical protein
MSLASRRNNVTWTKENIGSRNPNFNGGRYIDDKGYIRVLMPKHPYSNAGYVYEHRLVAESILGRFLQPWETVHHINEIKIDNRWENFYLTTVPEHSSIHREGKKYDKERRQKTGERSRKAAKTRKRGNNGKFVKNPDSSDILDATHLEGENK